MPPEGPNRPPRWGYRVPVPMRHPDPFGKPCDQVIVHRSPLLKLCHPEIPAWNSQTGAVAPVLLRGCADVVCSPIVHAYICQGDHPRHRRAPSMVGQAMQMARSPDRAPEPFYALFPSDCLIKKDLKGTCFRWDKPGNRGGFARPRAPRLRFACMHCARVRASLLEWLRVEHAQWRMCFEFGKIPSCVRSRLF